MSHYRAELTGVFGDPVDDNPTGIVEEAAFAAMNLNYRYLTIKVLPEDLETAMSAVRAMNFRGINLTMPHKIRVLPMLDELSEAAGIIGAVNTVINQNGKLIGENTDGKGFTASLLKHGIRIEGANILVLGAGGAARAISVECALAGAGSLSIANRTEGKAEELAALIREKTKVNSAAFGWNPGLKIPENTDILINATSIGLMPDADSKPALDYSTVREDMTVADVVFNPSDTLFLKTAREHGAGTISGIGMLVQQAALNFTLWTGERAPVEVMYDTLKKEFEQ